MHGGLCSEEKNVSIALLLALLELNIDNGQRGGIRRDGWALGRCILFSLSRDGVKMMACLYCNNAT